MVRPVENEEDTTIFKKQLIVIPAVALQGIISLMWPDLPIFQEKPEIQMSV